MGPSHRRCPPDDVDQRRQLTEDTAITVVLCSQGGKPYVGSTGSNSGQRAAHTAQLGGHNIVFTVASSGEITRADRSDRWSCSVGRHIPDEFRACNIAYGRGVSGAVWLYFIEFPETAISARKTSVETHKYRSFFCDTKRHKFCTRLHLVDFSDSSRADRPRIYRHRKPDARQ